MIYPIFWLTGNMNAGKSTLAFGALDHINHHLDCASPLARRAIVLDGDDMRETISQDKTLSPEDRRAHNLRIARLANLLSQQGHVVIVSVIAPFEKVRQEIEGICQPKWVHVYRGENDDPEKPYEKPDSPDLFIDNTKLSPKEGLEKFMEFIDASVSGASDR